jgi:KDO2-lipid IV(A) lauroyltransferase
LIYPLLYVISLLPLNFLYFISNGLYYIVYHLVGYRKKIVNLNLRKSFPEKTDAEIEEISKKFYKHFCRLFFEILKTMSISEKEIRKHIKYRNPEILDDLYQRGKSAIVVCGHYGNWEWLTGLVYGAKHKTLSVYKPLSSKFLENILSKSRSKTGAILVPIDHVIPTLIHYKRENIPLLSCFIADQSPVKEHIKYWTTFLNQDTPVYYGVEKIAKMMSQAVLFYKMIPVKKGYYEVEIIKISDDGSSAPDFEITETHVKLLEDAIKERPEYWLWTHRRWKLSHLRGQKNLGISKKKLIRA